MVLNLIKRQIIKQGRLTNIIWPLRSNGLYCFNFHRIGDAEKTPFDPCVYSCDGENFEKYLNFFQKNFRIIDINELHAIIQSGKPVNERLALITFDDGYSDNYHVAYPILKAMNIPATFFITTSLVESNIVPWWDEIAWHIKQIDMPELSLSSWKASISLSKTRG